MRSAALAVGVAVLLVSSGLEGQQPQQALEGAWRVTEVAGVAGPGPGAPVLDSPQPGLLLFTGRYYSYTLITGDQPRLGLPSGVVSAADLLGAWNPFTANAGTFEISDNTMIRRPIVAKNPGTMAPGVFNEYTFRLSADTLWVTTVGTESGPALSPPTVKYLRVR